MKRKTTSYMITGVAYNSKLKTPEHLRPLKPVSKAEILFILFYIASFIYFAYGIIK